MRVVLLWLLAGACAGEPPSVRAAEIRGEVTQGGKGLESGAMLAAGEEITVGNGRAVLEIEGGSTLRVYSDTRLRIGARQGGTSVRLTAGKLWAIVAAQPAGRLFELETDGMLARVRGTELVVETDGAESEVGVVEGEVDVTSDGETVRLGANQRARARRDEKPKREGYDPDEDRDLWDELERAFQEVKALVRRGVRAVQEKAPEVKETVVETAPKVGKKLGEGARELGKGVRKLFE